MKSVIQGLDSGAVIYAIDKKERRVARSEEFNGVE